MIKTNAEHWPGHLMQIAFKFSIFLVIFSMIFFLVQPQFSLAEERPFKQKKVVSVGYYLYDGYQERDEAGVYSGYGYDYLKEISQFADWQYEFVEASFSDCIKMLEEGKIDIVGGIDKEALDSDKIGYSHYSNYTSEYHLYTKQENRELHFDDFGKFDNLSIGILNDNYQEEYLDDYCGKNKISPVRKYYDTTGDLEKALETGEIEAIYASAETNKKYDKIIASMDEHRLYYGVNKNNEKLLNELDKSMLNIKNSNPSYDMQIQNKYFIKGSIETPAFTSEELEYIKKKKVVKVSYDQGWQPVEYYDEKTGDIKGVTKDLFELLEKYTGLEFEFVRSSNLSEALGFVKTGEADMISLVSHDYGISEQRGIYTSSICINASLVGVISKERAFDVIEQIAMPEDYYLDIMQNYDVVYYETVEECFDAVNSGDADATIANAYAANYYLANPKFVNLIRQDLIGYSEDLSLGVSQNEDIELLNILNKGLHCISDMDLSNIILSNYVVYEQPKFRKLYYSNPVLFLGIIVISVMFIIGVLIYVIVLKNKVNSTSLKMIEFLNVEKERVENSLRDEAEKDPLTGVFNRRKIETEVKEFLLKISVDHQIDLQKNRRGRSGLHGLIMLDLDNFKKINDSYGHPEGDRLLKRVASELEILAGEDNLAGRLGGDEFIFLFKNITGKTEAKHIATQVQKVIGQIAGENENWANVSASIGVTLFSHETYSFKELYERADRALYKAKSLGKNVIVFHEEI